MLCQVILPIWGITAHKSRPIVPLSGSVALSNLRLQLAFFGWGGVSVVVDNHPDAGAVANNSTRIPASLTVSESTVVVAAMMSDVVGAGL